MKRQLILKDFESRLLLDRGELLGWGETTPVDLLAEPGILPAYYFPPQCLVRHLRRQLPAHHQQAGLSASAARRK